MAKKRAEKPKRQVTRRQLSRWQRQKRRQRIIIGIGISVISIIVGLVGTGIYLEYKPLGQTVVEVNDTKFNMDYYVNALKYHAGGQDVQYIQFLLDPVLENIKQNELIRQEALELGISISNKEIDEEIKSRDLPRNQAVRDLVRAQLLIERLRQDYFEPQLPLVMEQKNIMAMFLESQSQVAEVKARLESGEDFAMLAGELSLDSLTGQESGDLGWRPRGVLEELLDTSVFEDSVFSSEVGILSQPLYDEEKPKSLGYWLAQVLERKEDSEEVHVQAMLLASEEEAQGIKARLESGEDFAMLAGSHSQLPGADEDKGDLGWLAPGSMSQAVSDFIFDSETELDIISEPIRDETASTSGGYWLFRIMDSDTREPADEDRDLLVAQAMDDWLASLIDDPEARIVSYLDDEMKAFAADRVQTG